MGKRKPKRPSHPLEDWDMSYGIIADDPDADGYYASSKEDFLVTGLGFPYKERPAAWYWALVLQQLDQPLHIVDLPPPGKGPLLKLLRSKFELPPLARKFLADLVERGVPIPKVPPRRAGIYGSEPWISAVEAVDCAVNKEDRKPLANLLRSNRKMSHDV